MCKRKDKQVSQIPTIEEGNMSTEGDVSKKEQREDKEVTEKELSKARIGIIESDGLVRSESASDAHSSLQASPSDFVLCVDKSKPRTVDQQMKDEDAVIIGKEELTIYSSYVRKVFRAVIEYYPNVVYGGSFIRLVEPYASLFHYYYEMCEYASHDVLDTTESPDDFKVFQSYYQRRIAPDHDQIRATIAQNRIQFDQLWALYRPGDILFTLDSLSQTQLYSMISADLRSPSIFYGTNGPIKKKLRYAINGWFISWNNSMQRFSRFSKINVVDTFEGTRSLTSLPCYPLKYHRKGEEDVYKPLEHRGNVWKNLVVSPSCHRYKGVCRLHSRDRDNINDENKKVLFVS